MSVADLTILLVVLPLLAAPLVVIVHHGKFAWLVTTLVCAACFGMALTILLHVNTGEVLHYELGGWAPPWGIEYRIDSLNALVALIVSAIAFLTCIYAPRSVSRDIPEYLHALFYAAFLLCFLGLLGIALTGDIFNLFVFLEISSLSSYALIALGHDRKALTAAFHYLILGTLGATFFLIGVGLLYAATGTLNMQDLATQLTAADARQTTITAIALIVVGLALKAAIYPLHLWLPSAYHHAPNMVTVFLSATATKVSLYALIRCLFDVFPMAIWLEGILPYLMLVLGSVAVLYGAMRAMGQSSLKATLAYSSVSQIGYIVMGLGLVSQAGLTAAMLHMFNHAVIKACLFMVAGAYIYRVNSAALEDLRGMGRAMPWTFFAMVIGALSLIGVPGTAGFVSKWTLIQAAIDKQLWGLVFVVLLGSLMAVVYFWRWIEVMYFQPAEKPHIHHVEPGTEQVARAPKGMVIAIWAMVFACLYFGLNTELSLNSASAAAQQLLNMGANPS